jgi:hypothetical protein
VKKQYFINALACSSLYKDFYSIERAIGKALAWMGITTITIVAYIPHFPYLQ